jgi:heme exporter protein A
MLKVRDLAFSYGRRPLLDGVSFVLPPGSLLQIKGSNGAGKSTLLQILCGILAPTRGEVVFSAQSWDYLPPGDIPGLFLKLSALENLRFWLRLKGVFCSQETLEETLEIWGIRGPLAQGYLAVERFSTGMKKKLGLIRLILSQSHLWLLDEPLSGLDQNSVGLFHQYLKDHLDRGGSVLFVSHEAFSYPGAIAEFLIEEAPHGFLAPI